MSEQSPLVTEQWCRDMGFRRTYPDDVVNAGGTNFIIDKGDCECLIGVEFNNDSVFLFVECRCTNESVVIVKNPTQRDVEMLDELVTMRREQETSE